MTALANGAPTGHEAAAEQRRYLQAGFAPLTCATCGTAVMVRKHSEFQTSVQWTSDPVSSCEQFAAAVAGGTPPGRFVGCSALRQSIADAFADGRLAVVDV